MGYNKVSEQFHHTRLMLSNVMLKFCGNTSETMCILTYNSCPIDFYSKWITVNAIFLQTKEQIIIIVCCNELHID